MMNEDKDCGKCDDGLECAPERSPQMYACGRCKAKKIEARKKGKLLFTYMKVLLAVVRAKEKFKGLRENEMNVSREKQLLKPPRRTSRSRSPLH